jgi:hypothetical protein
LPLIAKGRFRRMIEEDHPEIAVQANDRVIDGVDHSAQQQCFLCRRSPGNLV